MTTYWLFISRAVHIGGCLLFFGLLAFDRIIVAPCFAHEETQPPGYSPARLLRLSLILLSAILLSGFAWFFLVAMTMSGESLRDTFTSDTFHMVLTRTRFGIVWQMRGVLWLGGVAATVSARAFLNRPSFLKRFLTLALACSGCLLASLVWAGHGQEGGGWHECADIVHLLVAGFWPAGLFPLGLMLKDALRAKGEPQSVLVAAIVSRFSTMSVASVALLAATGLANSYFLVGSVLKLFEQPYGRWLLAKIIFFLVAVVIGAVNLLRLKPRLLANATQEPRGPLAQLQRNVLVELLLSTLIILIIGVLGILPPPGH